MKKFIFNFVLFVTILYIILIPLKKMVDKGLRKSDFSGHYVEWNAIFDSKIKADIIVMGSSIAWCDISTFALDSILKMNSYNLGLDGNSFLMQYFRFKAYIDHNPSPKYVIQCLDDFTLSRRKDLYVMQQYLPYLSEPEIIQGTKYFEGYESLDYEIPILKYRHSRNSFMAGLFAFFTKNQPPGNGKYKGYKPKIDHWDPQNYLYIKDKVELNLHEDKLTDSLFTDYINFCKDRGICLILVYPPNQVVFNRKVKNLQSIMNTYKNYSQKYHLPLLDYSNSSIALDTANFADGFHLNNIGADKFNQVLCHDIDESCLMKN